MGTYTRIGILIIFFSLISFPSVSSQVAVTRNPVSAQSVPGSAVSFTLSLIVSGIQEGLIVTETIPDGWTVSEASPSVDKALGNEIKWLLNNREGIADTEITYIVDIPSSAQGTYAIQGTWKSIDNEGRKHSGTTEESSIHVVPLDGGDNGNGGGSDYSPGSLPGSDPSETPEQAQQLCSPGFRKCANNTVLICDEEGMNWLIDEVCDGACEGSVCIESRNVSDGNRSEITADTSFDLVGRFLSESAPYAGLVVLILIIGIIVAKTRSKKRETKKPQEQKEEEFRYEFHPRE